MVQLTALSHHLKASAAEHESATGLTAVAAVLLLSYLTDDVVL